MSALRRQQAICAQIIKILQETREQRGLSKYIVAERSGLSQQMIGYVERGLRQPSLETVLRMADAIEIDLAKVIQQARRQATLGSKVRPDQ